MQTEGKGSTEFLTYPACYLCYHAVVDQQDRFIGNRDYDIATGNWLCGNDPPAATCSRSKLARVTADAVACEPLHELLVRLSPLSHESFKRRYSVSDLTFAPSTDTAQLSDTLSAKFAANIFSHLRL